MEVSIKHTKGLGFLYKLFLNSLHISLMDFRLISTTFKNNVISIILKNNVDVLDLKPWLNMLNYNKGNI